MKTFKIWSFILFAGLLSGSSRCVEVIENVLKLKGHKSGIYIHQSDKPTNVNVMGIEVMFQKIDEKTAIYAIFEYENNNSSASIAKQMLETALEEKSTEINWKTFLENEMIKIETRLMQDNVSAVEAESCTGAQIIVVDGNTVTTAQVGLSLITAFVKHSTNSKKLFLKSMSVTPRRNSNVLGGKIRKERNPYIGGDAIVSQSNDPLFIVMGTTTFWRIDDYDTAESILKNVDDYKEAAERIAKLNNAPRAQMGDYGVIIIALRKGNSSFSMAKSICKCVKF